MSETVQANDGAMLPISSLPQTLVYTGSFISKIVTQYAGNTYEQTFLNDGTNIVFISGWVNPAVPVAFEVMADELGVAMVDENGIIMITNGE